MDGKKEQTMSEIPERVIFTGATEAQIRWGGNDDPNKVCEVGKEYEIESRDVRSYHTKITLVGVEGVFNNVSFSPASLGAKPKTEDPECTCGLIVPNKEACRCGCGLCCPEERGG